MSLTPSEPASLDKPPPLYLWVDHPSLRQLLAHQIPPGYGLTKEVAHLTEIILEFSQFPPEQEAILIAVATHARITEKLLELSGILPNLAVILVLPDLAMMPNRVPPLGWQIMTLPLAKQQMADALAAVAARPRLTRPIPHQEVPQPASALSEMRLALLRFLPRGSPCMALCQISDADGLCQGCQRNRDEIAAWLSMSEAEKAALLPHLAERRHRRQNNPHIIDQIKANPNQVRA